MILGIHDGHNASSSLIKKDKILFAMSEERFTRKKNQRGFPEKSVNYILNNINTNDDIDYISIGGVFRKGKRIKNLKNLQNRINKKFLYVYHHISHSYLFKLSNFKETLVISIDGGGDGLSFLASVANKNNLEIIAQSDLIDSVGDFYASITELLGFKPMEDEGKVMSLSSYEGKDDLKLTVIDYIKELKSFKNYLGVVGGEATKTLKRYILGNKKDISFEDKVRISKFAQKTLEDVVLKAIDDLSKEYNLENVVFVGGVAQNVKLNSKIAERYNLFVPPFMGDEGLCLGASLADKRIDNLNIKNTYFGYEIENEKVEKDLELLKNKLKNYKNYKIDFVEEKDIPEVIGSLILDNKIVCLSRGKMEFGPRALGNRSIISLPTKENKEKINKKLKRSWFMPFAPTILYEFIDDYLINPRYSPFMTQIFRVKEDKIKEIEGVIHVDKTTRPQTLKKESNKTYYEMIRYIYDSINIPVVLNTSFNLHGEPIVCTEKDAINSFLKADFDALLLGNYLISKIEH